MYELVGTAGIQEFAKRQVLRDREQYYPVFRIIEQFANDAELILYGEIAKKLMLNESEPPLVYELYSQAPFTDGKRLASRVYKLDPEGFTRYTMLSTRVKNIEMVLYTNQREICRIKCLPIHRSVKIFDLIRPITRKGLFASIDVKCIGPELQLIEVYDILSTPSRASEWETTLKHEKHMRKLFYSDKGEIVKGGGSKPQIVNRIISRFVTKEHCVIGDYALSDEGRLQLITSLPLSIERERLLALFPTMQFTIDKPQLPVEMPVHKLTARIEVGGQLVPVLSIFDVARFTVIPTNPKKIQGKKLRVGALFVQAKFALVDIWTIKVLSHMKMIEPMFAETRIRYFLSFYRRLFVRPQDPFPKSPSDYIGNYIDFPLYLKRQARINFQGFTPPFYPVRHVQSNEEQSGTRP